MRLGDSCLLCSSVFHPACVSFPLFSKQCSVSLFLSPEFVYRLAVIHACLYFFLRLFAPLCGTFILFSVNPSFSACFELSFSISAPRRRLVCCIQSVSLFLQTDGDSLVFLVWCLTYKQKLDGTRRCLCSSSAFKSMCDAVLSLRNLIARSVEPGVAQSYAYSFFPSAFFRNDISKIGSIIVHTSLTTINHAIATSISFPFHFKRIQKGRQGHARASERTAHRLPRVCHSIVSGKYI